ncbi:MAG: hypothetical protein HRU15_19070 [Planctomycetes bacterium]|nr:hypothetical protein [Planctomycetota bacterium]
MRNLCKTLVPALALSAACATSASAMDSDPFAAFNDDNRIGENNQLRWGGYGELHYNNFQGSQTKNDVMDLHRLVFLAEYEFDEKISFFTEIEIEHAFVQGGEGELEVEQAYIDFKLNDKMSIQGGVLLVPISILNLYHEPTLFYGVERSYTQKYIVPTTWFEPGVSIKGEVSEELSYQVALQSGLDNTGFSESGIRSGRQKAYKSKSNDFMVTARTDYHPMPELWLAAAVNFGNSGQDIDGTRPDGSVFIYTLEARYDHGQYKAGLSWNQGTIGDAAELSTLNSDPAATPPVVTVVPESFNGLEVFGGVDIMPWINAGSENRLDAFVKFETFDTQADIPSGSTAVLSKTGTVMTYGFDFKPHPNVVVKLDYQDFDNDADSGQDQWNLGLGWMF